MTPATLSRTLGGLRWGLCIVVASALACESPGAVAPLPALPPPPPSLDLGDPRGTVRCGNVAISAGPPRRIAHGWKTCEVAYLWDVAVTADDGEAMLMDLFRDYLITDWRVRRDGPGWRHNISVLWSPFAAWSADSSFPPDRQAMVIHACPEGERGQVLACYEDSCQLHQDPDQVRPFIPSTTGLVLRTPPHLWGSQDLGEGETLRIPIRYTAYKDVTSALIEIGIGRGFLLPAALSTVPPREYRIGPLRKGDSGVVTFAVMAEPGRLAPGQHEFTYVSFDVSFPQYEEYESRPCALGAPAIRLRTQGAP